MCTVESLINDLVQADAQKVAQARQLLLKIGTPAVEPLASALAMLPDPHRWKIILILSEIGESSIIPSLVPFLDSPSPAIRAAVAQFLGKFGDEQVVEILLAKLHDPKNDNVSIWIMQALGKLKDTRAVEALIRIVYQADTPSIRYTAIEALGAIGDYRAADTIRDFTNDSDHHVKERAQAALQNLYAQRS